MLKVFSPADVSRKQFGRLLVHNWTPALEQGGAERCFFGCLPSCFLFSGGRGGLGPVSGGTESASPARKLCLGSKRGSLVEVELSLPAPSRPPVAERSPRGRACTIPPGPARCRSGRWPSAWSFCGLCRESGHRHRGAQSVAALGSVSPARGSGRGPLCRAAPAPAAEAGNRSVASGRPTLASLLLLALRVRDSRTEALGDRQPGRAWPRGWRLPLSPACLIPSPFFQEWLKRNDQT